MMRNAVILAVVLALAACTPKKPADAAPGVAQAHLARRRSALFNPVF